MRQAVGAYKNSASDEEKELQKLYEQLNTLDYDSSSPEGKVIEDLLERIEELEEALKNADTEQSVEYRKVGEDLIPIPKGFYYVGGTKTSGVVISDDPRDEDVYKEKDDVPSGADDAYNDDGTIAEDKLTIKGNQFVWIPCDTKNYAKIDFGMTNANAWEEWTNSAELQQIYKYGGFYVGRFEAGTSKVKLNTSGVKWDGPSEGEDGWLNPNFVANKDNGKVSGVITEKPGEIPYYHSDYQTAQYMSSNMYTNNQYVYSGLTTGTMWDMIMAFISNKVLTGDYSEVKNTNWGNYYDVELTELKGRFLAVNTNGTVKTNIAKATTKSTGNANWGILTTASTETAKKKNMYDLAGNLWEWTQEACWVTDATEGYMVRGGSFNFTCANHPVCYRRRISVGSAAGTNMGFRPALFIK